jgi:acyl carrier protein phosphodiesterase
MNFLAHLYLSGNRPKIMVGNFIGDFVKGRNPQERYEPEIAAGIELHRSIDHFTDTHEVVKLSKNRLRPKYRHYSGVIIDMFYDHFLAKNWIRYSPEPLPDFAHRAYQLIEAHDAILPEKVKYLMPYMTKGNWLLNYAHVEGLSKALNGMTRRSAYDSKMNESVVELEANYDEFENEFVAFFPELDQYCKEQIIKSYPLL